MSGPIVLDTEMVRFLKESLIENEIRKYLDENRVPLTLCNDINFLELVSTKIYLECHNFNLKDSIDESFFTGVSPDEIKEFYSQSKNDIQREFKGFSETIEKYRIEYDSSVNELETVKNKINSIIYNLNKE